MGNCFSACSQRKQRKISMIAQIHNASRPSTSHLSNASLKRQGTASKKSQTTASQRPSARTPKFWPRKTNRVSPCIDDSVGNARCTGTLQESVNCSSSVSHTSGSSELSVSSEGISTCHSSNEEFSTDIYQPVCVNEKSRTPTPFIEAGVTQGRLIIVQPCKSISPSSFNEIPSSAELPRVEKSFKTSTIYTEAEAEIGEVGMPKNESLEICPSTSSFGSWSDDPQNIDLDLMSEDESCKVFPYIAGMQM